MFARFSKITFTFLIAIAFNSVDHGVVFSQGKKKAGGLSDAVVVFEPGASYTTTRIPALVLTPRNTLLAFCEARANSTSDWAEIDLLMRRSRDGGKTWEEPVVIAKREVDQPLGNPTPIVGSDGTIHLLFQRNYANAFYMRSTDDGISWSDPVDITYAFNAFRPEYDWKVLAPGPGHAIQLKNGRLLVPVWICDPDPSISGGHRPSCVATVYSDDQGKTWHRGDIISCNDANFKNPSESVAVELGDGTVLMNMRNESDERRRMVSISPNGSSGWTAPVFHEALYEPICMASMIRTKKNGPIIFVNPDSEALVTGKTPSVRRRVNLTAKVSFDQGKTWDAERVIDPGNSGYSDLAVRRRGTIYCVYETNDQEGWKYKIVLRTFDLKWLSAQRKKSDDRFNRIFLKDELKKQVP